MNQAPAATAQSVARAGHVHLPQLRRRGRRRVLPGCFARPLRRVRIAAAFALLLKILYVGRYRASILYATFFLVVVIGLVVAAILLG